jgi:hypothetical protein
MKQIRVTGIRVLIKKDDTIIKSDIDEYRKAKEKELYDKLGDNYFIDLIYKEL